MVRSCEHNTQPPGSIKCGVFIDWLSNSQLLKMGSATSSLDLNCCLAHANKVVLSVAFDNYILSTIWSVTISGAVSSFNPIVIQGFLPQRFRHSQRFYISDVVISFLHVSILLNGTYSLF
jgi:hypothetical protein